MATTEDTDVEPNETFTVGLTVSGTTATVTATDTATGTINDDDSSAVTVADASASEGDSISFTVTLSKAVSGGLKVTPGFTDVTATEGTDYTENTTALTFTGTAGETKTFTVATTEDTDVEPNETFTVGLTVSGDDGDGDGDRHGDGDDQRRRQFGGDDGRRLGQRGRLDQLHGDAVQGGVGRAEGDAQLHRRDNY